MKGLEAQGKAAQKKMKRGELKEHPRSGAREIRGHL